MEDLHIGCSWVPATPAKPNSTTPQLICTNWQEKNFPVHANWPESEGCTNLSESGTLPGELPGTQCQRVPAFRGSGSFVDVSGGSSNWQAREFISSSVGRTGVSFGNLLALAHADIFATSSSSSSRVHCHTINEASQFTVSFGNPLLQQEQEYLLAEKSDNAPNTFTGGSSFPASRPFIDLNSLPTITDVASSKSKSPQFETIIPSTNNQGEHQISSGQDFGQKRVLAEKDQPENNITRGRGQEPREMKEKSQLLSNLLNVASIRLQENNKPDNGDLDEADLIKTPPQKARRKKHRPKVVIEGQLKRTPKSSARKSSAPQDTTRVKRKYVRRKGVDNVLEEGTDLDYSASKRKYARKTGINIPEGSMDNGTTGTADWGLPRYTRSSCRRSLNFNLDGQEKDGSSTHSQPSNCNRGSQAENSNAKDQSRINVGIVHQHDHFVNLVQEVSEERCEPSPSPSMKNSILREKIFCTRHKCQIVFSDVSHDKEVDTVQMGNEPDKQRTQRSLTDSICSSTYLTPERKNSTATAEAEVCNKYGTGTEKNSLKSYLPLFSQNGEDSGTSRLYFPATCKKRRTERHTIAISSLQYSVSTTGNRAKLERRTLGDSSTNFFTTRTHSTDDTQKEEQDFQDRLVLGPERIKKRRSGGRKRLQDLSSLLKVHELPAFSGRATRKSRHEQGVKILHEPQTCMEVLVLGTHSTMTKKKRSKSLRINSTVQYNQQTTLSIGPPIALTWKCIPSVDSITEQFKRLDLNVERFQGLFQSYNALMEHHTHYQERHALVPFQRYGTVVPYDSSFEQVRRRQPRPKVNLDDETTRVWKLLLENINCEGIDGTDEENTKRWEEERRVFTGRANSFIARMRLVQGDRHFSPWKGSVVDSVVGVFLTQNVSDHLSSSAFMSLVAKFPINSKTHPSDLHEEKPGTIIREPEVYDTDPGGTSGLNKEIFNQSMYVGFPVDLKTHPSDLGNEIKETELYDMDPGGTSGLNKDLNQSVYVEDTEILQHYDSMREVDSVKSSGNGFNGSVSEENLRGQSTVSSKCDPVMYNETVANKSESSIEDGGDIEDSFSSQKSSNFIIEETTGRSDSCSLSCTSEEPTPGAESNRFTNSISFVKLLQRAGSMLNSVYEGGADKRLSDQNWQGESERLALNCENWDHLDKSSLCCEPKLGGQATHHDSTHKTSTFVNCSSGMELCAAEISGLSSESASHTSQKITADSFLEGPNFSSPNAPSKNNDKTGQESTHGLLQGNNIEKQVSVVSIYPHPQNSTDVTNLDNAKNSERKDVNSVNNDPDFHTGKIINRPKAKRGRTRKKKEVSVKWNHLREQVLTGAREGVRTANRMDSVDWDAVRCADVNEIAQTIKERGMNNMLAQRIKNFLNRIVRDHGSIDLEWLRDVPPDKAKEYLLSIRGLGLKSVECVRLLTLHHVAFPVDTNVGRIAVRLGWVPLQPLPESLQLHLLEMYPILESIQKYLWPRLCKLDQGTLYELHYQMITFGKVFCTKNRPNCNACPMRGECRHFASAFASSRLALPSPEEKQIISTSENRTADQNPIESVNTLHLLPLQVNRMDVKSGVAQPIIEEPPSPECIIEVPGTPEEVYEQVSEGTVESAFNEESDEIPTIQLNMEEFTNNLQEIMQQNTGIQEGNMSKALVALTSEAASIPEPKLKNISRLRTEHRVYELPDSHPLLKGMNKRERDDPCPYLLAIWTPGETVDSIEPPETKCSSHGLEKLCTDETCSSCNSIREANSQTVRGTLLIPCRTAMRGSFPLNGTYFQVNEVFSDHESSLSPLDVPRAWLWNLPRRTVFFGTSIPTIFKGLSTEGIQYCFWRGFVCVRGFDRQTRAPRPLVARLHFPASKLSRRKGNVDEEYP